MPLKQLVLPVRTLKVPFSFACQVTVVPALVGFGDTLTIVTVGAVTSLVAVLVAPAFGVGVLVDVRDGFFVEVGVPFDGVHEGSTKAVPVGILVSEGIRVGVLVSAVGVNVISV